MKFPFDIQLWYFIHPMLQIESNDKYLYSGPPFLILLHPALGPLWEVTRQKVSRWESDRLTSSNLFLSLSLVMCILFTSNSAISFSTWMYCWFILFFSYILYFFIEILKKWIAKVSYVHLTVLWRLNTQGLWVTSRGCRVPVEECSGLNFEKEH